MGRSLVEPVVLINRVYLISCSKALNVSVLKKS